MGKDSSQLPVAQSALTRVIAHSLGGNATTAVIATIDPLAASFEDSQRSLALAERAVRIANRPVLNANSLLATVQQLREDVRRTRDKLNLSNPANCKCQWLSLC